MDSSQIFTAVSIGVLVLIVVLRYIAGKGSKEKYTPLSILAFGCILAGILFGQDKFLGYALLGAGLVLAVMDILIRSKKNK